MLGLSAASFTLLHVIISLIGIATGFIVIYGFIKGKESALWTTVALTTTTLTSVTGFGFPFEHLSPAHKVGILSLAILALAIPAKYPFKLSGLWRWVYVVGALLVFYLNFFVLIVQSFLKIPALHSLAPKGSEPAFLIGQVTGLILFVALGVMSVRGFRVSTSKAASKAA